MAEQLKMSPEKARKILETLKYDLTPHDWQIVKEILEDSMRWGIVKIDDAPPQS
jgi:hypothetical protein